jgi:hypothetical protein
MEKSALGPYRCCRGCTPQRDCSHGSTRHASADGLVEVQRHIGGCRNRRSAVRISRKRAGGFRKPRRSTCAYGRPPSATRGMPNQRLKLLLLPTGPLTVDWSKALRGLLRCHVCNRQCRMTRLVAASATRYSMRQSPETWLKRSTPAFGRSWATLLSRAACRGRGASRGAESDTAILSL